MGKVVTSEGLQDFVQTGKVTHVNNHVSKDDKPVAPAKAEAEKPKEPESKQESAGAEPVEQKPALDEGLEPEDADLTERVRKKIAKKHKAWKEAESAAQEAERFAENIHNDRVLERQRADRLQAELDALKAQVPQAPKQDELKEPDERDPQYFGENGQFDWKKFAKALSQYETRKALAEAEESRKQEQAATERQQKEAAIRASTEAARKLHPDFDEVMRGVSGTEADQVPQFVLNYLGETENAGLVAYHLAKYPEEAKRISTLKPIRGISELGKLESKLTATEPPKVETPPPAQPQRGGAPPPIVPLEQGSASVNRDPAKMSYKELRAYERERMKR